MSVSLCSSLSGCSRFRILNRSVHCNSNRESSYDLFLLVRAVRVVRGSCFSSRVFVVILTAKCAKIAKACMACFSLFVPFPSFAVHGIQVVSAIDSNRERRENREQKRKWPCRFKAVQGRVQGEGFPSPPGWEPRAVKKEEALVRVVRGSRF